MHRYNFLLPAIVAVFLVLHLPCNCLAQIKVADKGVGSFTCWIDENSYYEGRYPDRLKVTLLPGATVEARQRAVVIDGLLSSYNAQFPYIPRITSTIGLAISPDGSKLAAARVGSTVGVDKFVVSDGKKFYTYDPGTLHSQFVWLPDSSGILDIGFDAGTARVKQIIPGQSVTTFDVLSFDYPIRHMDYIGAWGITDDGKLIVTYEYGSTNPQIDLYELDIKNRQNKAKKYTVKFARICQIFEFAADPISRQLVIECYRPPADRGNVPGGKFGRVELWVCNLDGSHMRQIHSTVVEPVLKDTRTGPEAPCGIQWIPGASAISYLMHDSLWKLPIPNENRPTEVPR